MIAAAVLAAVLVGAQTDWEDVWRRTGDLLALDAAAPARGELRAGLAQEAASAEPGARRDLLEALLRRADGDELPWSPPEAGAEWPFGAEASWLCARLVPEGPDRVRALQAALAPIAAGPPGARALPAERLQEAWESWLAAALELRYEDALTIGRVLHRDQEADWSALSLALTATRAGRYDEADAVLDAQIDRGGDRAALSTQRAITALGAGDDARAREALGAAILWGSVDAIGVVARIDLGAGRREAARAGFRAALLRPAPGPWARRGWGLSLLPSAEAPPGPGPDPASW